MTVIIELQRRVEVLEAEVRSLKGKPSGSATTPLPKVDLNGQYGDPVVRFNPRGWEGATIKGVPMSTCPPEALRKLASALQWFAEKNDREGKVASNGKPSSFYDRLDAARALAWAERLESGNVKPPAPMDDDDFPEGF